MKPAFHIANDRFDARTLRGAFGYARLADTRRPEGDTTFD